MKLKNKHNDVDQNSRQSNNLKINLHRNLKKYYERARKKHRTVHSLQKVLRRHEKDTKITVAKK